MEKRNPDLKLDYLEGMDGLRPFYRHPFPAQDYRPLVESRKRFPIDRALLVSELQAQNAGLPHAGAVQANIALLQDPNTFTVTTGHQLCWMGGPMFTIYKITTAIRLAERIQAKTPGARVVPVFWMATEDHDWEEINHYYPEAGRKVAYAGTHKGPVGRHVLTQEALAAFAEQVPEALRAFYQPGERLADVFRRFIHHLFGHWGLVILDGDSPRLKAAFKPWMAAELSGNGIADAVRESMEALQDAGYTPPAKPRDINLFYLGHGGRSGIVADQGQLSVPDAGLLWSQSDALAQLEQHPEDFSPNVVFRPLYQEMLLPNLAYVGGWAEIGYWMQLAAAFERANLHFPMLQPRMSASIATAAILEEAGALGFSQEDFQAPVGDLQERYLLQRWNPADLEAQMARVLEAYGELAGQLEGLDPTLATSVRGERGRAESSMENLLKKVKKGLRNRDPKPYQRLGVIKNLLYPEQEKQERLLNFTAFPVPYAELIAQIYAHCEPENYTEGWIKLP